MQSKKSTIDDLIDRQQSAIGCPYPIFAELRQSNGPIFHESLGAWIVSRYEDVRSILRDTERFSSLSPTGPAAAGEVLVSRIMSLMEEPDMAAILSSPIMTRGRVAVLLSADPPDHRRQRRLVNPAFRPDRIRAWEPEIEKVALQLISKVTDEIDRTGQCDVVSAFAVGLPMAMIAMALGVDDEDLARFKRWSDDIVMPVGNHAPSLDQVRGFVNSTKEFSEYFLEQLALRRTAPRDDILSDLANGRIEQEELTDDEQLGMIQQFLVAGNETTTTLITNIVKFLAENPDEQERVRADRTLVEPLVEEMLRFEAPVGGLFRQAKVDLTIGESRIAEGDHLWLVFASANRDEHRFADADVVDLTRHNVKEHLAFGNGEHFCPGAGLARAEARIATNVILDHLADLRLVPGTEPTYSDSFVLRGLLSLVVTAGDIRSSR